MFTEILPRSESENKWRGCNLKSPIAGEQIKGYGEAGYVIKFLATDARGKQHLGEITARKIFSSGGREPPKTN